MAWLNGPTLDFSRSSRSADSAFIEPFNAASRAAYLNVSRFLSLADVRAKCSAWQFDYNTLRPHGSIGQKPRLRWQIPQSWRAGREADQ